MNTTPTISRTLEAQTLVELLYDAGGASTSFAVFASGNVRIEPALDLPSGERLAPISPNNNLLTTECVLLPSAVGEWVGKDALLAEVRDFLHRYVDLPEIFEALAAHYVLLTWVYDAF